MTRYKFTPQNKLINLIDSDSTRTKMNNKRNLQPSGEGVDWTVLNSLSHQKEAVAVTGGEPKDGEGVDWKLINNLSHQKEAVTVTGGEPKDGEGVDWKLINNLSHQKEAINI